MTVLVLVAASGLAREVIAVEQPLGRYDEIVLVDDDAARWGTVVDGATVIGPVEIAAETGDHDIVVCAGSGSARRRLVARLATMGVSSSRYARIVHPSVALPERCAIGPGSVLLAGVVLTADVYIHRHVVVMPHVTLTHDDVVGDYATLCAGVSLGGEVTVGEAAYVGMNSSIRQRVHVGADSTLGMGAVLLRDLPPGETWAGVPAANLNARQEVML